MSQPHASRTRNARLALICVAVLASMTGAGFAAVPLYRVFCQVTGFEGTVGRAQAAPGPILDRTIDVRFDANVRDLPWTFKADQVSQTVRIGETRIAHFTVVNNGTKPVSGQATFNVLPETTGAHFKKVQCFCFEEQTLDPGETMDFPVVYFVDPAFATDPETRGKQEITLSYTFYPSKNGEIETAGVKTLGEPRRRGL
jgi:cytochrome c oxidase assembly protein subunit 11